MSSALRVGITGGIGSGKTAVTKRLEDQGIEVVDADLIAREVVARGSDALGRIADHFGAAILTAEGDLDRAALRQIIFDSPEERRWLEQLTHPLIAATIRDRLSAATSSYAVLSSPLLLESTQKDAVDYVVVVDVPESLQLSRTMARDENSAQLVKAIMDAQLSRARRLSLADEVIDNSGTLEDLDRQVDGLNARLLQRAGQRSR